MRNPSPITVDVTYHGRDIFTLLAMVGRALVENGRAEEVPSLARRVFATASYGETVALLSEHVILKGLSAPGPRSDDRIMGWC